MEPNRGAADPCAPNGGARWLGSRALRLMPLFGAPKRRPSKNLEMGGAPVLDGRHLKVRCNNQSNDGVDGRGDVGEAMRTGGTRGRGRLIVLLGDK
jgi:hypothetical protein